MEGEERSILPRGKERIYQYGLPNKGGRKQRQEVGLFSLSCQALTLVDDAEGTDERNRKQLPDFLML